MLTEFEKQVLEVVKKIPRGKVATYKEVAKAIGKPLAYRAVGNALAKNPYPIKIPCHRVIKSDLSLGGYSQGKEKKKKLLDCLLYTSPSPRDRTRSRMPSSA